jgi:hypothetical protein
MTYDQGRKRTILFGQGSLAPDSSDTWLWDGEGWIQVADIGPRSGAAKFVIYDPIRDKIVLFGGGTWEWDGTNWVQVASQVIGPLSYARGAWDSKRQRMVAVTELAHGACLTWEWNGAEWAQVSEEGPPWRYGFDVAYDDERQKLILFGGNTSAAQGMENYFGDTWAWDGASWEQVSDFGPLPRTEHMMVNDKTRARIVLFGGSCAASTSDSTNTPQDLADTWEWDGSRWMQLQDMGPAGRWAHSLAYDTTRRCVVLFGGLGLGGRLGDTWELAEYS